MYILYVILWVNWLSAWPIIRSDIQYFSIFGIKWLLTTNNFLMLTGEWLHQKKHSWKLFTFSVHIPAALKGWFNQIQQKIFHSCTKLWHHLLSILEISVSRKFCQIPDTMTINENSVALTQSQASFQCHVLVQIIHRTCCLQFDMNFQEQRFWKDAWLFNFLKHK